MDNRLAWLVSALFKIEWGVLGLAAKLARAFLVNDQELTEREIANGSATLSLFFVDSTAMATDGFFKHYPDYAPGEKPSHLQKPKDTGKAKFQKRHKDQVTSEEVFMRIESDHEHQFVFIPTEPGMVEAWRKDPSIPLAQVVGVFEVFVRRGSTRGSYDHPSTGELQYVIFS